MREVFVFEFFMKLVTFEANRGDVCIILSHKILLIYSHDFQKNKGKIDRTVLPGTKQNS